MTSSNANISRVIDLLWGEIHRSPALMFSLMGTRNNGWANSRVAGDFRRHGAHCDVTIMLLKRAPWCCFHHPCLPYRYVWYHYSDLIMGAMAPQITSLTIVYSNVYSGADQRRHQSTVSLAFVRGIHRWTANSLHKGPVTRKCFHLIMPSWYSETFL